MDDYLRKPIEPRELAEALSKWLPAAPPAGEPAAQGPPRSEPAHDVFNEQELLGRLLEDRILAGKVIARFLEDTPAQLRHLQGRLETGDAVETRRLAHGLKGAASTVAAGTLRTAALKIEEAALAGDLAGAGQLLPSLEKEFEQLRSALREAGWA